MASIGSPFNIEDSYKSNPLELAFKQVSQGNFLRFISEIFREGIYKTPEEFARIVEKTAWRTGDRGIAEFFAIPTPENLWGWYYKTTSDRRLIWIPKGIVYSRGLTQSKVFIQDLERAFGPATKISVKKEEPTWLADSMALAIRIDRPCYHATGETIKAESNRPFFRAIANPPKIFYDRMFSRRGYTPGYIHNGTAPTLREIYSLCWDWEN
jgi:hypothetical protein